MENYAHTAMICVVIFAAGFNMTDSPKYLAEFTRAEGPSSARTEVMLQDLQNGWEQLLATSPQIL